MKIRTFALSVGLMGVCLVSSAQLIRNIKGNKDYVATSKRVDHFTEVRVTSDCEVIYEQGEDMARTVRIEAASNIIDMISVEVKKSVLKIGVESSLNVTDMGHIRIKICSEELYRVMNSGSGVFIAKGKVKSPLLDVSVSGNGKIEMTDLDVNELKANISSNDGEIKLKGKANEAKYKIQLGGEIKADSLEAKVVKNVIFAGGTVGCYATKYIKNTFWGAGQVYYRGTPEITNGGVGKGKVFPLK